MPTLRFNGGNQNVQFNLPSAVDLTAGFTVATLVMPRVAGAWQAYFNHNNAALNNVALGFERDNSNRLEIDGNNGSGSRTSTSLVSTTTKWWLNAVTKAPGNQTPRFHMQNVTDGGAWIHENAGGTAGDAASAAGGRIILGEWNGSDDLNANMALDAAWTTNLADLAIEALTANLRTSDWTTHATLPKYVHELTVTSGIVDLMGNGATFISCSATQDTGNDPAGWTFDGLGSASFSRSTGSSVSFSDAATHAAFASSRSVAEAVAFAEAVARVQAGSRVTAQTLSLLEAGARGALVMPRSVATPISVSEAPARAPMAATRSSSAAVGVSHTPARGPIAAARAASEAVSLAHDVVNNGDGHQDLTRSVSEAITFAAAPARGGVAQPRSVGEAVSIAAAPARVMLLNRSTAQSLALSHAVARLFALARSAGEDLAFADQATRAPLAYQRAATEAILFMHLVIAGSGAPAIALPTELVLAAYDTFLSLDPAITYLTLDPHATTEALGG